ncbi:hypothetical protein [Lewinella sp. LCG006]
MQLYFAMGTPRRRRFTKSRKARLANGQGMRGDAIATLSLP